MMAFVTRFAYFSFAVAHYLVQLAGRDWCNSYSIRGGWGVVALVILSTSRCPSHCCCCVA